MKDKTVASTEPKLHLPAELVLMLLNEETGYFYFVPGWNLNCAMIGAVLAELSLKIRIDTDLELLHLINAEKTGEPILDMILEEIVSEKTPRSPVYWIERLAAHAETVIDSTLKWLVEIDILRYHDGNFWTLVPNSQFSNNIRKRIGECIFSDTIPDPKDAIVISLCETCDVCRLIYELDPKSEARIEKICRIDLIGYYIARAVKQNIASPTLKQSRLSKKIPTVPIRKFLFNPNLRIGYIPMLFADIAKQYGPVFQVRFPFQKPLTFIAGPQVNRWAHRNGRVHLRTQDYFTDIEKVYGAAGLIPALDGADHFRLRRAMQPGYSRARFDERFDELLTSVRQFMKDWSVGSTLQASKFCRKMINAQVAPLVLSIESQDIVDDLIKFKERALLTHVGKVLPKFCLSTPGMKRSFKAIESAVQRVERSHTPSQRIDCPRDLADDLLNLHVNDPQFLPESNLQFSLSAPMLASMYLGDSLGFALFAMVTQPDLYAQITREADDLFGEGDPKAEYLRGEPTDVTKRFVMESLRLYPIIPMSIRNVMNTCVIEGFDLPVGKRIHIVQTASHYMDSAFPEPYKFDIDRYLPPREEHRSPSYSPYGWGTHRCLGSKVVDFQLTLNLLMIAHYFTLELTPANYKLGFNPLPSMSPNRKLKFRITEQRHPLPT